MGLSKNSANAEQEASRPRKDARAMGDLKMREAALALAREGGWGLEMAVEGTKKYTKGTQARESVGGGGCVLHCTNGKAAVARCRRCCFPYRAENIIDPEHTVNATQGAITRTNRCIFGFTASSSSIQRKMTAR